jgi:hypothetical protein
MKEKTVDLFEVNSDLLDLFKIANEIGWSEFREPSIHRILYLSSVLYSFMNKEDDLAYANYHFSLSLTGPYSEIIDRSITDLKRREIIIEDKPGNLSIDFNNIKEIFSSENSKIKWFRIIVYILGLYGEERVFGFVIQDPQYIDDFQRNSQKELDISDQNKTIDILNRFKIAFEETLNDVSEIDDREYLELYFEYIFGKIIKRN